MNLSAVLPVILQPAQISHGSPGKPEFENAASVSELGAFSRETDQRLKENELSLLVAKIEPSIADVPARYYHLFEERNRLVRYIEATEQISVLHPTKFMRRDPKKWAKE